MTHAEGAIGELKTSTPSAASRGRGTRKAQIQLLMAATAVNLKRLARYAPAHTRNGRRRPQSSTTPRRNGRKPGLRRRS